MATPSNKSPGMDRFLSAITGKDRRSTIEGNKCMTCPGPADTFRDDLSRREYTISGMCQKCQDSVFGEDDEPQQIQVKCPDCPDGTKWTANGPTDQDCPTCHGEAYIYKEAT